MAATRMPFVEPPSPSSHRVHFETTCIVIPEQSEQPAIHFEKHSIPLPIWRRSQKTDAPPPPVITVRVPSISRKHRRLQSVERPLQPCLRHSHSVSCSNVDSNVDSNSTSQSLPLPSPSPPSAFSHKNRRTTMPAPGTYAALPVGDTIPLRDCCQACLEAAKIGLEADYHEHYTKGALRRRRASESNAPSSTGNSSGFLAMAVKVDEVDSRRGRKHPNAPRCLPPVVLDTLCADVDDDEALLFPLPSPRRTPLTGSPGSTPPKSSRTPSPRPPPSPRGLAKALSETQAAAEQRYRPAPKLITVPEPTGEALLARYPDVDVLPTPLPSRRVASESAATTGSVRSSSNSPTTRRLGHSLFRTISPPTFPGW